MSWSDFIRLIREPDNLDLCLLLNYQLVLSAEASCVSVSGRSSPVASFRIAKLWISSSSSIEFAARL